MSYDEAFAFSLLALCFLLSAPTILSSSPHQLLELDRGREGEGTRGVLFVVKWEIWLIETPAPADGAGRWAGSAQYGGADL